MRRSRSEKVFEWFNIVILVFLSLLCLFPFIHLLAISLSSSSAVMSNQVVFLPVDFQWNAYREVFRDPSIMSSLFFTIQVTVLGTFINLFLTVCAAYPLSKRYLKGRNAILLLVTFTMFFSGGMIPTYMVVRNLGLTNNIWSLVLPVALSTFNMYIMKTYFSSSIPDSIEEAARIDGCNEYRIIYSIILPLSLPILATLGLFYAVERWNTFMGALLYINNPKKFTLQLKLRQLLVMNQNQISASETTNVVQESLKAAIIIFSTIPILLVYPWLQKYFAKGVMVGSIKG